MKRVIVVGLLVLCSAASAGWIEEEGTVACERLLRNISPPDSAPGTVVASPSRKDPDYYYHWVRDAALVLDSVMGLHERAPDAVGAERFETIMKSFIEVSRRHQHGVDLGEPKFNTDGSPFTGPWGRPQTDGPALRASVLIRYARILLERGEDAFVRENLYDGRLPARTVIKQDLEFVAHRWRDPTVDLWEEVRGTHFYTRMVQRKALLDGAWIAERLGDSGAARFYREQAAVLRREIMRHWSPSKGILEATLGYIDGNRGKWSDLDAAVVLGALHGDAGDGFMALHDGRVLATAEKMRLEFDRNYAINATTRDFDGNRLATAIGRYPEDTYDGHRIDSTGNPWFLATNAFAELCYRLARHYEGAGAVVITELNRPFLQGAVPEVELRVGDTLAIQDGRFEAFVSGLRAAGDRYLMRTRHHAARDGSMSEQLNRATGIMQGAEHLSWSYASFLTAIGQR